MIRVYWRGEYHRDGVLVAVRYQHVEHADDSENHHADAEQAFQDPASGEVRTLYPMAEVDENGCHVTDGQRLLSQEELDQAEAERVVLDQIRAEEQLVEEIQRDAIREERLALQRRMLEVEEADAAGLEAFQAQRVRDVKAHLKAVEDERRQTEAEQTEGP